MGDRSAHSRLPVLAATLLLAAIALAMVAGTVRALPGTPPAGYEHGGATCATCHGDPATIPTATSCTQCHKNAVVHGDPADYSCWTCHKPGEDMTAAGTSAGCSGVCHLMSGPTGTDYPTEWSHKIQWLAWSVHLGSDAVGCRVCHTVSAGALDGSGSPHHATTDFTAPVACTDCHGNPSVSVAPTLPHGVLVSSVSDCYTCHQGFSAKNHPTQAVKPTLTFTAGAPSGGSVALSGRLMNGSTPVVGVTVYLQRAPAAGGLIDVGTTTTSASGSFTFTCSPAAAGDAYRAITAGWVWDVAVGPAMKAVTQEGPVPSPAITSFTPASGLAGALVTLIGTGFRGATAVTFNGAAATSVTVVSDTKITAKVPSGATSGAIAVTTLGGTGASATKFSVRARITLKLSGLTLGTIKLGKTVAARGAVTPLSVGERVTLLIQKKNALGRWVRFTTKSGLVKALGNYSIPWTTTKRGVFRMQTSIAASAAHTKATSLPSKSFRVK